MDATPRRLAFLCGALPCLALGLFPSPGHAQTRQGAEQQEVAPKEDVIAMLVSRRWCHEGSTGISFHTTKLRFQLNGVLLVRKDTEMANGSHTGSNSSARWEIGPGPLFIRGEARRWEVGPGVLIIPEPNGGESRLPVSLASEGNTVRLTLGTSRLGDGSTSSPNRAEGQRHGAHPG